MEATCQTLYTALSAQPCRSLNSLKKYPRRFLCRSKSFNIDILNKHVIKERWPPSNAYKWLSNCFCELKDKRVKNVLLETFPVVSLLDRINTSQWIIAENDVPRLLSLNTFLPKTISLAANARNSSVPNSPVPKCPSWSLTKKKKDESRLRPNYWC